MSQTLLFQINVLHLDVAMPQQQSTAMIRTAAKDLAETITDRVEDTIQSEKERYIKYKASVNTSIFLAQQTRYWSKRATRITKFILLTSGLLGTAYLVSIVVKRWLRQQRLAKLRVTKRIKREDDVKSIENRQNSRKTLNDLAHKIEKMTVEELVEAMKSSHLSVVDVLHYFQDKTVDAHHKYNHITELITDAEIWAKELDDSENKNGILFGLPVELKDHFAIKGYDCVLGLSTYIDKPMEDDCVIVKVLKQHGAIPFVKSNVPQALLSYDCENPVYGVTLNPCDPLRTCGGSSGGTGAMIASGSTLLGFGTDLGGSLRVPAHFCGVATLKMTANRISDKGLPHLGYDKGILQTTFGPTCKTVDGLVLASRALLSEPMFKLDGTLVPKKFDDEVFHSKRPLRIGMYTYDGIFEASPPCVRAVECARKSLEAAGHEVVLCQPFGTADAYFNGLIYSILNSRSGLTKVLEEEKLSAAAFKSMMLFRIPYYVMRGMAFLINYVDPWKARILNTISSTGSLDGFLQKKKLLKDYREAVLQFWDSLDLDAVICPAFTSPAMLLTHLDNLTDCGLYLSLYNALDFPSGIVPVTHVNQADKDATQNYPLSSNNTPMYDDVKQCIQQDGLGLPVGVQCVTRPYQEELCLRVMKHIESKT